jgi:hypothetical protein
MKVALLIINFVYKTNWYHQFESSSIGRSEGTFLLNKRKKKFVLKIENNILTKSYGNILDKACLCNGDEFELDAIIPAADAMLEVESCDIVLCIPIFVGFFLKA